MTDRLHGGAGEDPVAGRMQEGMEWGKKTLNEERERGNGVRN